MKRGAGAVPPRCAAEPQRRAQREDATCSWDWGGSGWRADAERGATSRAGSRAIPSQRGAEGAAGDGVSGPRLLLARKDRDMVSGRTQLPPRRAAAMATAAPTAAAVSSSRGRRG